MIEPCYQRWLRKLAQWLPLEMTVKGFTTGYGCLEIGNVIVEEISLIDGLMHNLLSVSQFCDKGYEVLFKKEKCMITDKRDQKLALQGVRKGDLFVADWNSGSNGEAMCFYGKASSEDIWLWHKKLSHLNFKTMNSLVKRELVRGLPEMEFCPERTLTQHVKRESPREHRTKGRQYLISLNSRQLLHMDLFGPVNVMSMSKKRYCLVIIDDYSKYTWVLFLHSKDKTRR